MKEEKEEKKVMLITSVFPPSWGSGVHRVSKFHKYLPVFGYLPIVLTTKEDSYGVIDHSIDEGFNQGKIIRLPVINWRFFSRKNRGRGDIFIQKEVRKRGFLLITQLLRRIYSLLSIPDDRVLWIPLAILKGYRILHKERVAMLYSTSPHCSCHIVALLLHRLTGTPWVADFRDPWVGNPFSTHRFSLRLLFDHFLERQVVKSCSRVVSISGPIVGSLKERYPDVSSKKFAVLPSSFDPADLIGLDGNGPVPRKFVISHAGTFYGNRSPKPFLDALMKLLEQRPDWKDYIEVLFIGSGPQNGEDFMSLNSLRGVVRIIPYLPYKEMLKLLTRSSALLLIPGPGKGTMTGKVFDYIAARKPILLLSQENTELEKMLRRMGIGLIVSFNEVERIIECLATIIQACIEGGGIEVEANEEEIGRFTSLEMARKLADIMDEVRRDEWG